MTPLPTPNYLQWGCCVPMQCYSLMDLRAAWRAADTIALALIWWLR